MIVPDLTYEPGGVHIDASCESMLYSGGISSGWYEVDDKPRRPIGFRMPEPEPVIDDPSWLLL